ncbi:MAG: hypothetical protein JWM11_6628 [Planctomycetaceae bacterium]|nr:hypothetical protein [Planctomycetaceae bacterium]
MSMKACLTIASLFLLVASTCSAQGPQLIGPDLTGPVLLGPEAYLGQAPSQGIAPIPESAFANPGGANPGGVIVPALDAAPMLVSACQCEYFSHVRYKNKGKISPCARTMVVSVLDPCSTKCDCETKCVQVKICAPTCGCPKVKVSRTGRHTRYDFGKYAIDIYSNRNGTILVDYDA